MMLAFVALALPLTSASADTAPLPGAALYKTSCSSCHGPEGAGTTKVGVALKVRDLRTDEVQSQTDLELMKVIAGGKGKMPAYGKKLTTEQIQSIIAFIRTLKAK
jgi:mono/diheme cytochrome c family protein